MNKGISPFTHTPGVAGEALVVTQSSEEIINNFESPNSYKYVYKIVGLRGSGKSVEYSMVMNHFRNKDGWLVYALSADGDPLQTLISNMSIENFISNKTVSRSISANAKADGNLAVISGEVGVNTTVNIGDNEHYYSAEVTLKEMLKAATLKGYKVLIGVDDIAKTDAMVSFLSILGTILMEPDKDIRFICTGTSKNIEDFVNVPHLSFFVRNESISIGALDLHLVAQKYRELLGISPEDAVALSKFTNGYAYGYQVLGEVCFRAEKSKIDDEIKIAFDEMIGSQYDIIWSSLTPSEQDLIRIIVNSETESVAEIKSKMANESGFASLRDRLIKKHILVYEQRGKIHMPLPRFKEYVNLWQ